jgi:hypothetical protein
VDRRRQQESRVSKLVREALAIDEQNARDAGALGYMARILVQTTIPHSSKSIAGCTHYERSNGNFHLTMTSTNPRVGLPYGRYPRLLLAWLTTEAVRTRSPQLELGFTLGSFMESLSLTPTGGRWGTIPNLRAQMKRLFTAAVSCHAELGDQDLGAAMLVARRYHLWWDPQDPEQAALWKSTVTLSDDFFKEIISRPVPLDMRALRALKYSSLALDIYAWLVYRMSYLRERAVVPWASLQLQFGADFTRTRAFREAFLQHLKAVLVVYPAARVDSSPAGLVLTPSPTHVPRLR